MPHDDFLAAAATTPPSSSSNTGASITPTTISTLQKIRDVKLSPDGSKALYQVIDFYKPEPPEEAKSELWI
ncbi:hypothetical protein V5O48_013104, partial [Marasmius crinis-equi]